MERDEKVTSAFCDRIWAQECEIIKLHITIFRVEKVSRQSLSIDFLYLIH